MYYVHCTYIFTLRHLLAPKNKNKLLSLRLNARTSTLQPQQYNLLQQISINCYCTELPRNTFVYTKNFKLGEKSKKQLLKWLNSKKKVINIYIQRHVHIHIYIHTSVCTYMRMFP